MIGVQVLATTNLLAPSRVDPTAAKFVTFSKLIQSTRSGYQAFIGNSRITSRAERWFFRKDLLPGENSDSFFLATNLL